MKQTATLLSFLCTLCVVHAEPSEVATTFGYTANSEKVSAGPYTLHYGESAKGTIFLVARGNHNIISRMEGDIAVYQKGLPWLSYKFDEKGNPTDLSMAIMDASGKEVATMIDKNVDGQWDIKIDHTKRVVLVWRNGCWVDRNDVMVHKNGQWVDKAERQPAAAGDAESRP